MIRPKDFVVSYDSDLDEVVVIVTHAQTGLCLDGRPSPTESTHDVREKLLDQMYETLYKIEEFEMITGRWGEGINSGTFYAVVHKPSGKTRGVKDSEKQSRDPHFDLLDELVAELWREQNASA